MPRSRPADRACSGAADARASDAAPPPQPEGRRARRQRETRAALLGAALDLLRERGIYGTRVEDITQRADVGKGVFYNHFASKEEVVAHLLRAALERLDADYFARVANESTLSRRIDGLARAQEAFFEDHPEYAMVLHQARGLLLVHAEGADSLRVVLADYLTRLSQWIAPPAALHAWRPDDLLDAAAAIAGASAGYHSFCIAAGRPIGVATLAATLEKGIPHMLEERRLNERPVPRRRAALRPRT